MVATNSVINLRSGDCGKLSSFELISLFRLDLI